LLRQTEARAALHPERGSLHIGRPRPGGRHAVPAAGPCV